VGGRDQEASEDVRGKVEGEKVGKVTRVHAQKADKSSSKGRGRLRKKGIHTRDGKGKVRVEGPRICWTFPRNSKKSDNQLLLAVTGVKNRRRKESRPLRQQGRGEKAATQCSERRGGGEKSVERWKGLVNRKKRLHREKHWGKCRGPGEVGT